jgi:hypothetical protein
VHAQCNLMASSLLHMREQNGARKADSCQLIAISFPYSKTDHRLVHVQP